MKNSNNALENLDLIALAVFKSPVFLGVIGAFGGVAQIIIKGESIEKRQILGCILMSLFIATPIYLIMLGLGQSDLLSAGVAILFSSMGESGYQVLIQRAQKIMRDE